MRTAFGGWGCSMELSLHVSREYVHATKGLAEIEIRDQGMVGWLIFSAQKVVFFYGHNKGLQRNPHQSNKQAAPLPTYLPPHAFVYFFLLFSLI